MRCKGRRRIRYGCPSITECTVELRIVRPHAGFDKGDDSALLLQATEYHLGQLKAKLAKLRTELQAPPKVLTYFE